MKFKIWLILIGVVISFSNLYSQNTYFIKYRSDVSLQEIDNKISTQKIVPGGLNIPLEAEINRIDYLAKELSRESEVLSRIIKISFDKLTSENSIYALQNLDPAIEYIQKSTTYKMDFVPNDTLVSEQWALEKIQAFDAWEKTTGIDSVLLAIVDTGIDYLHPDLENKIYINPGETGSDNNGDDKRSNDIDDDGNGFVDDFMGWDFTDRQGFPFDSSGGDYLNWDNDPMDEHGHGTYMGGIAGAEVNNITGVAGVAPNIQLVNLRAFDPSGFGEEDDVAAAILYAVKIGAKVVSMSFGDNAFSLVLKDVIEFAYSQGVVLVGSSGNSGSTDPHYPSGYSEVISVGNSTVEDFVAGNSNYGSTLDLVAPGSSIVTTARNNNYASISGTSAATPHVSATAALLLSLQNFTNEEVKQIIKSTTDDIGDPGWDLRSGAGRLNLFKVVTVVAPSVIKINQPTQDFATLEDHVVINASVLSPAFVNYSLFYGTGYNPDSWTQLIENGLNQFSNEDIFTLDITSLPDTVYGIRLEVLLSNGRTLEERVNFHISRSAPEAQLVSVGPAFYGNKTTILAAMYTDEPSLVRMYYRRIGEPDFNFVTLDGFTTNNQFIKNFHYGFLPKQIVEQNFLYDVYFEAENLVGLTTIVNDTSGFPFRYSTNYEAEYSGETELDYALPPGSIYENPVNLTSTELTEIFIRENKVTEFPVTSLYSLENNSFVLLDSLVDRLVRDFGDFNNNGLKNVLASISRDGFIYEQNNPGSSDLTQKFAQETGDFWPVLTEDIDGDNITELIIVDSDTSYTVWNIENDLTLSGSEKLSNFTQKSFGQNIIDAAKGVIADVDGDGTDEFWTVDLDGDIYSYEIFGPGDYREGSVVSTEFIGSAAFLAAGDYNGDGVDELAVLLHSLDEFDIAPFYRLIVFNLIDDQFNVLYDRALIDAATEFGQGVFRSNENSLRFADLDNDLQDELIVFMFPYAYIFKHNIINTKIIAYKENINSNSVFVGDLNLNGVTEIAFPTDEGIKFYEFSVSERASTPYNLSGYSISSGSAKIEWNGDVDQYYIYRGTDQNNLELIDSTFSREYVDFGLNSNSIYYYAVQGLDPAKIFPLSNLSTVIEVYVHIPGEVLSVTATSPNTVTVRFSEKMNNTIENLQAFELIDVGFPGSVAPATQFSYLLTFRNSIPVGENQLLIKDLKDLYGSPIPENTINFTMDSTTANQEFFISSFNIVNPYLISVTFNLEVDESTISNTNNFIFVPENKAGGVTLNENNKTILIDLKSGNPVGSVGIEYVMRIRDVKSSMSTGNIEINSGAGSYIVLTGFAKDLSDVYVYPNPVEIGTGATKLTFANLPRHAKLIIWTIDGTRIIELEETDGNGGLDFNLKDGSGNILGSGIYFYRIVMLDEFDNESEEKLGKFAIVR